MRMKKALKIVAGIIISFILIGIYSFKVGGNNIKDYKTYYNTVKGALCNYDSTLVIYVDNYDKNVYNLDVVKKILEDNPQLLGSCTNYKLKVQKTIFVAQMTFDFNYSESKETLQNREKAVQNKVNDIIGKVIKPGMKDYEKEAALHEYIVKNSRYDDRADLKSIPKESFTAYGILINGVGVCQGYALAMDRLLKSCGIESMMVTGEANNGKGWVGHAWNIVKLGGQYYHLDTTWDDPVTKDGENFTRYSYFNVTDEQIGKNHKWNKANYPKCNSTEYSFDKLNLVEKDLNGNSIIVVKNYDEFYNAVKKALSSDNVSTTIKITNFDHNIENVKKIITNAYNSSSMSRDITYIYYEDDMMNWGYVTVNIK